MESLAGIRKKRRGKRLKHIPNSTKRGKPHENAYLDENRVWKYKTGVFLHEGLPISSFVRRKLDFSKRRTKKRKSFATSHLGAFKNLKPSTDCEFSKTKYTYVLVNVVRRIHMMLCVYIYGIPGYSPAFQLEPKKFPSISLRIHPVTMILFPSGKLVITGARNELQGLRYSHYFMQILGNIPMVVIRNDKENKERWLELSYIAPVLACEISEVQNMVASIPLDVPATNLKELNNFLKEKGTWEPGLFPGLRYKMKDPDYTVLAFDSGKNIAMGFKNIEDMKGAAKNIYNTITRFSMDKRSSDSHERYNERLRNAYAE
jgi:transcription initiation factor TFIID TATA-box-binding protein